MGGQRAAVRVDPATGLKVFDTRAAPEGNDHRVRATRSSTDESLKVLPAAARRRRVRRRGAGEVPGVQGGPAGRGRLHGDGGRVRQVPRGRLLGRPGAARGADRRVRDPRRRRRLRRAAAVAQAAARPASSTSGSARRAATSAARGTGTAIPGIACDVESYSYLPLLEEMGYVPTMKFASGFEILEYCQKMAEQFGFYDHCLFHTTVEQTEWDEDDRALDGVHRSRRRHAGPLRDPRQRHPHHARSWPASTGMETLPGRVVPHVALELRRRPARASGSASSAPAPPPCRRSPSWPRSSSELYVFQRTPSTIDVRDQRATTRRGDRRRGRTSRAGPGPGGPGSPRSPPAARRSRPTTTTSPARSPTSRSASSTSAS